jgi:hypothetical protein
LTVTSPASSWDFAGVVDPAAGLVSADASAAGRVLVVPLADPDDEAGCGFAEGVDEADCVVARAAAPLVPLPLPFAVEDGVLVLPLADRAPEVPPDEEPPDEEPPDEEDAVDDAPAPEAPVEEAELAPAVFSPSAGA